MLIIVIAGNRSQFMWEAEERLQAWTNGGKLNRSKDELVLHRDFELGDLVYRFVSHPDHLKGLNDFEVERWGTWFQRPDLDDIEQEIKQRLRR